MRKIFGEEKSLLAREGEDRTMGKVLEWFELVALLDNYLYFNIQRTEKFRIAMCYTLTPFSFSETAYFTLSCLYLFLFIAFTFSTLEASDVSLCCDPCGLLLPPTVHGPSLFSWLGGPVRTTAYLNLPHHPNHILTYSLSHYISTTNSINSGAIFFNATSSVSLPLFQRGTRPL